jgi:DNA-binding response OmpR family regulator
MLYQNKPFAQPRVVILDDDDLVGAGLALLARDAGYEAAIFKSLSAAHAETESISVQAIISDFDLGNGPNGVEAARALRAHRIPAPPVLIVTALRRRSVETAAREAGFEVLSKPASPASLKRWLARNAPRPASLFEANRP